MPRRKLEKFEEINASNRVFSHQYFSDKQGSLDFFWRSYFNNNNPIIVEVGCGYGEYTIGLAENFPDCNVIGIDAKGDRVWKGMKEAEERGLSNVAFIQGRIEAIDEYFSFQSINELWIPFPDPQPKKAKKRLIHPSFIEKYRCVLHPHNKCYLKTDDVELFNFAREIFETNGLFHKGTYDVYSSSLASKTLGISTRYESTFVAQGKTIKFAEFVL